MDKAYEGKVVLITGTTGFIGSVLLKTMSEKLKGINRIYCLYHSTPPSQAYAHDTRVVWIKGDVTQEHWGISADRLQDIRENVNIIFHLAAYTRWDTGIQDQVFANTLSALHGANLAATFKKLDLFLVTSSYWAQCNRSASEHIEERIYQDFAAETELDEIIRTGSSARLDEWPNAYAYSKNLMERLLHQRYSTLPIMIARITSVTGAWAYPERGYCNFSISLPAFIRSIVLGGVQYFPASMRTAINDMIPVDICANLLLANAVEPTNTPFQVIHCSSATRNIPTLGEVAEMAGSISYYASQPERDAALSRLNEKQAKLNKIIVEAYGFAMANRFVFDDVQARRPLQWMSPASLSRFPIDVDALEWQSIIAAMKKELSILAAAKAA
jgi:nucleoside-diphosphate-sugar epimerase